MVGHLISWWAHILSTEGTISQICTLWQRFTSIKVPSPITSFYDPFLVLISYLTPLLFLQLLPHCSNSQATTMVGGIIRKVGSLQTENVKFFPNSMMFIFKRPPLWSFLPFAGSGVLVTHTAATTIRDISRGIWPLPLPWPHRMSILAAVEQPHAIITYILHIDVKLQGTMLAPFDR